jgi:deoxyribonucleoside regulator
MTERINAQEHEALLADVAQMYYLERKGQAEIAHVIGVTRSMVSRLLTEARDAGIVEIRIRRSPWLDAELRMALIERFNLKEAHVVRVPQTPGSRLLDYLGVAGAQLLKPLLTPGIVFGVAWGTSVSAVVNELVVEQPMPSKIVQLVGALGAHNPDYDGHAMVLRLAEKLGGESFFLDAPFLCPNPETASSILEAPSIKETINWGRKVQIALVGVGSTKSKYSSYYLAGYASKKDLDQLSKAGAVGDVCGLPFNIEGQDVGADFCERLVTIRRKDLLAIPVRIGVAGGDGKIGVILGALRGGYVNMLVTDTVTARKVLDMADEE